MNVIADKDWEAFAREIAVMKNNTSIPKDFFDHFYWGNIAAKAAGLINSL